MNSTTCSRPGSEALWIKGRGKGNGHLETARADPQT